MLLALALSLAVQGSNPPVTVKINHDQFSSGDRARVYVEAAQDGYLIVLHADADGRVRVLYPLDPRDDDFIRGGGRFEVRGRGDRDAFQVDGDEGSGTVLAAVSRDPLSFDAFVRNDHWDFRALGGPSQTVNDDPLAKLLDIVQRMAGDSSGRFDYDLATYVVRSSRYASRYGEDYYGYGYPHFGIGFYSSPFYNPFCDPFWGCYGAFGYPYGYGYGFGFGYTYFYRPRVFRPRPFVFSQTFGGIRAPTPRFTPVPARPRTIIPAESPARDRRIDPRVSRPASERPAPQSPSPRSFGGGREGGVSRGRDGGGNSRPAPRSFGGGRSGGGHSASSGSGGGGSSRGVSGRRH